MNRREISGEEADYARVAPAQRGNFPPGGGDEQSPASAPVGAGLTICTRATSRGCPAAGVILRMSKMPIEEARRHLAIYRRLVALQEAAIAQG